MTRTVTITQDTEAGEDVMPFTVNTDAGTPAADTTPFQTWAEADAYLNSYFA
jgi:hypothetical protein